MTSQNVTLIDSFELNGEQEIKVFVSEHLVEDGRVFFLATVELTEGEEVVGMWTISEAEALRNVLDEAIVAARLAVQEAGV